ncbi:MAG TPA: hypothetical protein VGF95_12615 [Solirubrobacteraceae bacterium]|jgi:hypothetical protein
MADKVIILFVLLHGTALAFGALFVALAVRGSQEQDDADEPEGREDGDGGIGSRRRLAPKPRGGGGQSLRGARACMRLHGPLGDPQGPPPRCRPPQPRIHPVRRREIARHPSIH